MILFFDPSGLPRAHAVGPEARAALVWSRAWYELTAYVAERRIIGESITLSDFKPGVRLLPDAEAPHPDTNRR